MRVHRRDLAGGGLQDGLVHVSVHPAFQRAHPDRPPRHLGCRSARGRGRRARAGAAHGGAAHGFRADHRGGAAAFRAAGMRCRGARGGPGRQARFHQCGRARGKRHHADRPRPYARARRYDREDRPRKGGHHKARRAGGELSAEARRAPRDRKGRRRTRMRRDNARLLGLGRACGRSDPGVFLRAAARCAPEACRVVSAEQCGHGHRGGLRAARPGLRHFRRRHREGA